jgi:hypothetical protein
MPNTSPAPASPLNSVTRAPIETTTSVDAENQAHLAPKWRRISSAWPRPVANPEADRQLLDDIENGDEDQFQEQQSVTPPGTALRRCHHAASISVGEHDDQSRADHPEPPAT